MAEFYLHPRDKRCPHCEESGGCRYLEIPESVRTYTKNDGEMAEHFTDHFGITHEYKCDNCDAEWIITNPEDLT